MMNKLSEILNFLKIKDLKELKEKLKNPLSQEGIKELEQVFEYWVWFKFKSSQNKFYNC